MIVSAELLDPCRYIAAQVGTGGVRPQGLDERLAACRGATNAGAQLDRESVRVRVMGLGSDEEPITGILTLGHGGNGESGGRLGRQVLVAMDGHVDTALDQG